MKTEQQISKEEKIEGFSFNKSAANFHTVELTDEVISIKAGDEKMFTIWANGEIYINPKLTAKEAAAEFWFWVKEINPYKPIEP